MKVLRSTDGDDADIEPVRRGDDPSRSCACKRLPKEGLGAVDDAESNAIIEGAVRPRGRCHGVNPRSGPRRRHRQLLRRCPRLPRLPRAAVDEDGAVTLFQVHVVSRKGGLRPLELDGVEDAARAHVDAEQCVVLPGPFLRPWRHTVAIAGIPFEVVTIVTSLAEVDDPVSA